MPEAVQIGLVLLILVGAVVLFATEKFRVDLVAVMVLGVLLITGLVTPEEGVSGFSNPATVTVGAMFVLSAGLTKTGALQVLARLLVRAARFPFVLMLLLIPAVALPSAFINNTPVVAVFLPLVLAVCAKRKFSPSKFLIPLSFASQCGGVCTLIGTSTNLLVSSISERAGFGAFAMFEFSRLGLIMVAAGMLYFLLVGYWLLPARRGAELTETYQLGEYITELRVMAGSPLIGKSIAAGKFGQERDVTVLEILRGAQKLFSPLHEPLREGDVLLVRGKVQELMELKSSAKLEIEAEFKLRDETLKTEELTLVEVLVPPHSHVIGRTLVELDFRHRYNAIALAIQRRGETLREKIKNVRLELGDALLLMGRRAEIAKLRADENFVVLEEVNEPALRRGKGPLALLIIGLVVLMASVPVFGERPLPILATAVVGCVAMVVFRCISLEEAYEAVDWKVIFLLAGVLPLGIAMEKTGTALFIAQQGVNLIQYLAPGGWEAIAVLAMMYALTAVLTECMSNNAAAVLLSPIAISTAVSIGVNPRPLLMAVAFAASTAFATPVGYQTNTMVYNPGGYRFTDFMKVGIPLNIVFWMVAVYYIPQFWPF
jgi:di/tricarboxylate transporter